MDIYHTAAGWLRKKIHVLENTEGFMYLQQFIIVLREKVTPITDCVMSNL